MSEIYSPDEDFWFEPVSCLFSVDEEDWLMPQPSFCHDEDGFVYRYVVLRSGRIIGARKR